MRQSRSAVAAASSLPPGLMGGLMDFFALWGKVDTGFFSHNYKIIIIKTLNITIKILLK